MCTSISKGPLIYVHVQPRDIFYSLQACPFGSTSIRAESDFSSATAGHLSSVAFIQQGGYFVDRNHLGALVWSKTTGGRCLFRGQVNSVNACVQAWYLFVLWNRRHKNICPFSKLSIYGSIRLNTVCMCVQLCVKKKQLILKISGGKSNLILLFLYRKQFTNYFTLNKNRQITVEFIHHYTN